MPIAIHYKQNEIIIKFNRDNKTMYYEIIWVDPIGCKGFVNQEDLIIHAQETIDYLIERKKK